MAWEWREEFGRTSMFCRPPGTRSDMQGMLLNSMAFLQARTAALVAPVAASRPPCWSHPIPHSTNMTILKDALEPSAAVAFRPTRFHSSFLKNGIYMLQYCYNKIDNKISNNY